MTKKVLVVNDIPGAGKVSTNINLPILSAAGFETSVLPTLILSKNTDYDEAGRVVRYPMNNAFKDIMDHWSSYGESFDVYTTGFFAGIDQIKSFISYYERNLKTNPQARLYVDPIMGDSGSLYPGFNPQIPSVINQLAQHAFLVAPNLTEACLMIGATYKEDFTQEDLLNLAGRLQAIGARNVVLTGIEKEDGQIGFFYLDEDGQSGYVMHEKFDYDFFGTGDISMSLIIALNQLGYSLEDTLTLTSQLTQKALEETLKLKRPVEEGVYFEPILYDVCRLGRQNR